MPKRSRLDCRQFVDRRHPPANRSHGRGKTRSVWCNLHKIIWLGVEESRLRNKTFFIKFEFLDWRSETFVRPPGGQGRQDRGKRPRLLDQHHGDRSPT